jgi:hypothetical protein
MHDYDISIGYTMANVRGPSSSTSTSTTASVGVLMVGPNFKVLIGITKES